MLTLLDYGRLAAGVYAADEDNTDDTQPMADKLNTLFADSPISKFAVREWQCGTRANGFQGAILENDTDVVCAYKGSKTGKTFVDDWLINDLQIAINQIPSQSWAAFDMCDKGKAIAQESNKTYSIVGHSLGGGLAQLVGYISNVPFVSFNAPGMVGNLPAGVPKAGKVKGFNMILWTDPVGNYGRHIGKTERFYAYLPFVPTTIGGTGRIAHVMGTVLYTLKHSEKWAAKSLSQLI